MCKSHYYIKQSVGYSNNPFPRARHILLDFRWIGDLGFIFTLNFYTGIEIRAK